MRLLRCRETEREGGVELLLLVVTKALDWRVPFADLLGILLLFTEDPVQGVVPVGTVPLGPIDLTRGWPWPRPESRSSKPRLWG